MRPVTLGRRRKRRIRPAKFWLTPTVHLATSTGLDPRQLREALELIETPLTEINHAWHSHFGA